MMYYLDMVTGESVKDFSCVGVLYDSKGEILGEIFDDGKTLKKLKDENFTIILNEEDSNIKGPVRDRIPGFVEDAGAVFILSDKGCQFFKDNGITNLEYFNLTIKGKGITIKTHKLVHVVSAKIDCINKEKSLAEYRSNGIIKTLDYLELNEGKIPKDQSLFLLAGFLGAKVFLRPELKEKITKTLTGFKFESADEFIVI